MFGKENFMITVRESGNPCVVNETNEITGIVDMIIGKRCGKTIGRVVDENIPNTKVVIVRTSYKNFYMIREIVEAQYPGVCAFKHV